MSTLILCGTKRAYLEDISSLPSTKRFRPSWSSPSSSSLDQLRTEFPNLQLTDLVKALEAHGNDLNAATKTLYSSEEAQGLAVGGVNDGETSFTASNNLPTNGDEWVELLVREVLQSNGTDNAKVRAAKVLEVLEKMLSEQAREQVGKKFQEENVASRQQLEALIKDNTILKRAVAIQHERQKALDEANKELQVFKQLIIPQYQEKLKNLEVDNYVLRMRVQQLEHGNNSIVQLHNQDVF